MFLRTKSIKGTSLVQLVESFRNAEGQPRPRVVASLGDVAIPDDQRKIISKAVEHELTGYPELFTRELSTEAAQWVARIVKVASRSKSAAKVPGTHLDGVLVDDIQTTEVVQLGPQLVALQKKMPEKKCQACSSARHMF
jgi:hypothetical protein